MKRVYYLDIQRQTPNGYVEFLDNYDFASDKTTREGIVKDFFEYLKRRANVQGKKSYKDKDFNLKDCSWVVPESEDFNLKEYNQKGILKLKIFEIISKRGEIL